LPSLIAGCCFFFYFVKLFECWIFLLLPSLLNQGFLYEKFAIFLNLFNKPGDGTSNGTSNSRDKNSEDELKRRIALLTAE